VRARFRSRQARFHGRLPALAMRNLGCGVGRVLSRSESSFVEFFAGPQAGELDPDVLLVETERRIMSRARSTILTGSPFPARRSHRVSHEAACSTSCAASGIDMKVASDFRGVTVRGPPRCDLLADLGNDAAVSWPSSNCRNRTTTSRSAGSMDAASWATFLHGRPMCSHRTLCPGIPDPPPVASELEDLLGRDQVSWTDGGPASACSRAVIPKFHRSTGELSPITPLSVERAGAARGPHGGNRGEIFALENGDPVKIVDLART